MAVREYETWLLWSLFRGHPPSGLDVEIKRGAKEMVRDLLGAYKPTIHQLEQTRRLDIATVWARSNSFDKLMRSLAAIFGVRNVVRPLLG
jgi:hypothetical protein